MVQPSCFLFLALLFAVNLKETEEAKILGLFPFPAKSHMIVNSALVKELASRGHEVTVVSPFPEEKPIPNYKNIALPKLDFKDILKSTGKEDTNATTHFDMINENFFLRFLIIWKVGTTVCDFMLSQEPMQKLIDSNEKFDLIIAESFYTDCLLGFVHKFKTPLVQTVAFGGTELMGDLVGNPSPYSYVPDPFRPFTDKMNFEERLSNTLSLMFQKIGDKLYSTPAQDKIMREYFKDPNMPYLEDIKRSTSLFLVNHHFSISHPRPLVPNYVQVGGMHIKPAKKLPADIQKYLDDAPEGVVYFSMGSNLKSKDMPKEKIQALVEAFGSLKQKVLWKWEDDSLPGQPKNLKVEKWLPQSDILAHPNVRLFITHGGLLSTQETIHRGVPVIGIPIFGDQKLNMARCENLGFGIKLDFTNITKESVTWAIKQIIDNPKYRENAQRLSRLYRDQPQTPLEQAIFWTEYVIRHNGAPHMRSAALDLTWYQYFLLDVIVVLAIGVGTILLVPLLIILAVYKKCCGASKSKPQVSSKKKRK